MYLFFSAALCGRSIDRPAATGFALLRYGIVAFACSIILACSNLTDAKDTTNQNILDGGDSMTDPRTFAALRSRHVQFLIGTDSADARYIESDIVKRFATQLDTAAQKVLGELGGYDLSALNTADKLHSLPIETLYTRFRQAFTLAKAYRTEQSTFFHCQKLKAALNTLLERLAAVYARNTPERENWWHWEIGFPLKLMDILLLLDTDANTEIANRLIDASRYFQPDAVYSGNNSSAIHPSGHPLRQSTGANRVDLVKMCVLRGIYTKNAREIRTALEALPVVWQLKQQTPPLTGEARDGFYADGSFIQHGDIPYTGTYGAVLLNGIAHLLYLIQGDSAGSPDKPFADAVGSTNLLFQHVFTAFEPLLYKGLMPDCVSGRSITRPIGTAANALGNDAKHGAAVLEALAVISKSADTSKRQQIESLIKRELEYPTPHTGKSHNLQASSLFVYATYRHLLQATTSIQPYTPTLYRFMEMERYFFRSNSHAIALALHSRRIGNYETMNKENTEGWYTGDGMVYLYDRHDNYRYFWHDADMHYMPGTTEVSHTMTGKDAQRKQAGKPAKGNPSVYTQGTIGSEAASAPAVTMDFYNWDDTLHSTKKWQFAEKTLVYTETGITYSGTGTATVYSVIEHKQLFDCNSIRINDKPDSTCTTAGNGTEKTISGLQSFSVDGRKYTLTTSCTPALKTVLRIYSKNGRNYVLVYTELGTNPQNKSFGWTLTFE